MSGAAKQALDPQHVVIRRVGREPVAEQLAGRVHAARRGQILFAVRPVDLAIEHEIAAVMHQRRARGGRGARERSHRERVHGQRVFRLLLRLVDVR